MCVWSRLPPGLQPRLSATAGVVFWQWGFEPYVSNSHFGKCRHCEAIQVSAADSVFTQIIRPTASHAKAALLAAPPLPGCTSGVCTRISAASPGLLSHVLQSPRTMQMVGSKPSWEGPEQRAVPHVVVASCPLSLLYGSIKSAVCQPLAYIKHS